VTKLNEKGKKRDEKFVERTILLFLNLSPRPLFFAYGRWSKL
jgi:hypothetical protein